MSCLYQWTLGLFFWIAFIGWGSQAGREGPITALLAPLRAYDYGQSRQAPDALDLLVRESYGQEPLRARFETELVQLLESDITLAAKQEICRRLALVGTDRSIPVLARLLISEDARIVEAACMALGGNSSLAASAALREALPKAQGTGQVAVINLLGNRRDAGSDQALAAVALQSVDPMQTAAVSALGKIATDYAREVLMKLRATGDKADRQSATFALLQAGRELAARGETNQAKAIYEELSGPAELLQVQRGALLGRFDLGGPGTADLILSALQGAETALKPVAIAAIGSSKDLALVRTFAARLPVLRVPEQVLMIAALATFHDEAVSSALKQAAEHSELTVRVAALQALGTAGDQSTVPLLVKMAGRAVSEESKAALGSLRRLHGPGVDRAILENILSTPADGRGPLISLLTERNATHAVPALLIQARQPDERICRSALRALGALAGDQDWLALLRILTRLPVESARLDAESALIQIAARSADSTQLVEAGLSTLNAASDHDPLKASLIRVLAAMPQEKTYQAVARAMRDLNPAVRSAALQALCDWTDARPLPLLLETARSDSPEQQRLLALRGYLRLLPESKASAEELARQYRQIMPLASRPEEKRLALSGLATVPHREALRLAADLLAETPVRSEAELAVISIARQLGSADQEYVATVLRKVIATTTDPARRTQAQALLPTSIRP